MVYTVGPLLVFSEAEPYLWLKYTLNDVGQIISGVARPYQDAPDTQWQTYDVRQVPLAYDIGADTFYAYKIFNDKLWRITSRQVQGAVLPCKFEHADIIDGQLEFINNSSSRTELIQDLTFELKPLLDATFKASLVLPTADAQVDDVHNSDMMLSPLNMMNTAISLDNILEKTRALRACFVPHINHIDYYDTNIFYFWRQDESWQYLINYYGEILQGPFLLDAYPELWSILPTDFDAEMVLPIDIDSKQQQVITSIYLKLTSLQGEMLVDMLRSTWPFIERRSQDAQISLALAVINGSAEGLDEALYVDFFNYRANFSPKYINEHLQPELFYASQLALPDAKKAKVADVVNFLNYFMLALIRELNYFEPITLAKPSSSLDKILALQSLPAEEERLLDDVLDHSNDEAIAHELARSEENFDVVERTEVSWPLQAQPEFAQSFEDDLLLQRLTRYYAQRFENRNEYLCTTSLFGFFQQGWGISRSDKLMASQWVLSIMNGELDYHVQDYQRHAPALTQGRLGYLFAALIARDGDNWHRANNALAV